MRNNIFLGGLVAGAILVSTCSVASAQAKTSQFCFQEKCFAVEVADTPEVRSQGLMSRASLDQGKGMLFVFSQADVYTFWMKNMAFSIDIVWLDAGKKVVHILENVPPCQTDPCTIYKPSAAAQYVLEIPAGSVAKDGVKVGDVAELK